jgi:hypothetical protein
MTTNVMKKFLKKLPKDIENIIKDDIRDIHYNNIVSRGGFSLIFAPKQFFEDTDVQKSYKKVIEELKVLFKYISGDYAYKYLFHRQMNYIKFCSYNSMDYVAYKIRHSIPDDRFKYQKKNDLLKNLEECILQVVDLKRIRDINQMTKILDLRIFKKTEKPLARQMIVKELNFIKNEKEEYTKINDIRHYLLKNLYNVSHLTIEGVNSHRYQMYNSMGEIYWL